MCHDVGKSGCCQSLQKGPFCKDKHTNEKLDASTHTQSDRCPGPTCRLWRGRRMEIPCLFYSSLKKGQSKGTSPCQIRFNKNTVVPCSSPPPPLRKFSAKPPRHEMTALQQESIQYVGSPPSSPHQKSTTTARDQDVVSGTGSSATPPLILVLNAKSASVVVSLVFFMIGLPNVFVTSSSKFPRWFRQVVKKLFHVLFDWGNG